MQRLTLDLGYRNPVEDLNDLGQGAEAFEALAKKLEEASARCAHTAALIQSRDLSVDLDTLAVEVLGAVPTEYLSDPQEMDQAIPLSITETDALRLALRHVERAAALDRGALDSHRFREEVAVIAPLDPITLAEAMALVERHAAPATALVMCPAEFTRLRPHAIDIFDPETRVSHLREGIQGRLWGASVLTTRDLPEGCAYALSDEGPFCYIQIER